MAKPTVLAALLIFLVYPALALFACWLCIELADNIDGAIGLVSIVWFFATTSTGAYGLYFDMRKPTYERTKTIDYPDTH